MLRKEESFLFKHQLKIRKANQDSSEKGNFVNFILDKKAFQ